MADWRPKWICIERGWWYVPGATPSMSIVQENDTRWQVFVGGNARCCIRGFDAAKRAAEKEAK